MSDPVEAGTSNGRCLLFDVPARHGPPPVPHVHGLLEAPHSSRHLRWTNTPKVIDVLATFRVPWFAYLSGMKRRLPFLRLWDGVVLDGWYAPRPRSPWRV